MRIHCLEHIQFETADHIEIWASNNRYPISKTLFYNNPILPNIEQFDWLIIMGGPMNIYEENKYSWLKDEKRFIEKAINQKKKVLGICFGAQLIANVLGAKVYKNNHKEIGWFDVSKTKEAESSQIFINLPQKFTAFHWHGDTFEIPDNAIRLAESKGCRNQAFQYGENVLGLQFHLEVTKKSIIQMLANCKDEITKEIFIQSQEQIFKEAENLVEKTNAIMESILENMGRFFIY